MFWGLLGVIGKVRVSHEEKELYLAPLEVRHGLESLLGGAEGNCLRSRGQRGIEGPRRWDMVCGPGGYRTWFGSPKGVIRGLPRC